MGKFIEDFKKAFGLQKKTIPNNKNERRVITFGNGRYLGGVDLPSGVYRLEVLRGRGNVKSEKNNVNLDSTGQTYPSYYNGFIVPYGADVEVNINGGVLFTYVRDIVSIKSRERMLEELGAGEEKETGLQNQFSYMDGWQFENFCARILGKNGYYNVRVTRGSGDQGVDVLAEKDGIKYAVQCKHYSQPVGNKAVQEIFAGKQFYHCHVGIVMTNSFFTKSAEELAKENGIILWDREYLEKFLKE